LQEGIWFALNVVLALAPIMVLIAVRSSNNLPLSIGSVLGDGFLYFFTVVLAASVISDAAKTVDVRGACAHGTGQIAGAACFSGDYLVMIILGGSAFAAMTLVAYVLALVRKYSADPGSGRTAGIASMGFAMTATILTIFVRSQANMW
jgi:hypothetical protein